MKAPLARIPLIGRGLAMLNPILVPRSAKDRKHLPDVVTSITQRATMTNPRYPPVLICE